MTRLVYLSITLLLVACSSSEPQYLPDGGPTSAALYSGDMSQNNQDMGSSAGGVETNYITKPLSTETSSMSTRASAHLMELQEDFRQIPNPNIVGYVMPHFSEAETPVPGYFTTFKLYDREHYAKKGEGSYEY